MLQFSTVQNTNNYQTDPANFAAAPNTIRDTVKDQNVSGVRKKDTRGLEECQTCANRRYQDRSNDPGVSFKAPTKLSPQEAATAVYSHEREHYVREDAKAKQEDREVLSNTITLHTAICPECGKPYISGGETRTVTAAKQDPENPHADEGAKTDFAKRFFDQTIGKHMPKAIDVKA